MTGRRSGRMTDGDLALALAGALVLAIVGAPGLGGLVALVAFGAYGLTHERRSGQDRRGQPTTRRTRRRR
jgi:hypothetical protein